MFQCRVSGFVVAGALLLAGGAVSFSVLWWVTGIFIALITIALGATCSSGSDAAAFINYLPGYLFANTREVLPWLYGWNAAALTFLLLMYLGFPTQKPFNT